MSAPGSRSPPASRPALWTAGDARAARALLDPLSGRVLGALLEGPRTQRALALALGLPLDAVKYRVRVLLRLGLVRQVGEQARAGRAMRLFAACADSYFVPFALLGAATLEEMFLGQEEQARRAYWRGVVATAREGPDLSRWGWHLRREGGELRAGFVPAPGTSALDLLAAPQAPALVQGWFTARLHHEQARDFQRRLLALIGEFEAHSGAQGYLLGVHFGPQG